MVAISLMLEGQAGLTWPAWKRLVSQAEDLGFSGLFRSDHFTEPAGPYTDSLEMLVSLAYAADHTQHVHFGPLVAPVSFRDPIMLARQAAALDDLSGGRMWLGLGAGWQEREHHNFGYQLGSVQTRMARFEEALEVVTRLLNSDQPFTFAGHFYQLDDAILLPRPARSGGPRIVIGGNGMKRTLPLAARYAHVWNAVGLSPQEFQERSAALDALLLAQGRQPPSVLRTIMLPTAFGRDDAELARALQPFFPMLPELARLPLSEAVAKLKATGKILVGSAEDIAQQIQAYVQVGASELMLQWLDLEDSNRLQSFAQGIMTSL